MVPPGKQQPRVNPGAQTDLVALEHLQIVGRTAAGRTEERLVADFDGTGMTVGPHPMAYYRDRMNGMGVLAASDLAYVPNHAHVRIAGAVIARQRPGTAKGFVFLSLEDETGIANAIITPDIFQQNRLTVVGGRFLLIEGSLQNVDNVISVKAAHVSLLPVSEAPVVSHDFH